MPWSHVAEAPEPWQVLTEVGCVWGIHRAFWRLGVKQECKMSLTGHLAHGSGWGNVQDWAAAFGRASGCLNPGWRTEGVWCVQRARGKGGCRRETEAAGPCHSPASWGAVHSREGSPSAAGGVHLCTRGPLETPAPPTRPRWRQTSTFLGDKPQQLHPGRSVLTGHFYWTE